MCRFLLRSAHAALKAELPQFWNRCNSMWTVNRLAEEHVKVLKTIRKT